MQQQYLDQAEAYLDFVQKHAHRFTNEGAENYNFSMGEYLLWSHRRLMRENTKNNKDKNGLILFSPPVHFSDDLIGDYDKHIVFFDTMTLNSSSPPVDLFHTILMPEEHFIVTGYWFYSPDAKRNVGDLKFYSSDAQKMVDFLADNDKYIVREVKDDGRRLGFAR